MRSVHEYSRSGLRLAWITQDIAVSRCPRPEEWPDLVAAGVRAVLDLREPTVEGQSAGPNGIIYRSFPIPEGSAPDPASLDALAVWVVDTVRETGPVLIHCREGRGRSPMVACATLMAFGYPARIAYDLVRRELPRTVLSEAQVRALELMGEMRRP